MKQILPGVAERRLPLDGDRAETLVYLALAALEKVEPCLSAMNRVHPIQLVIESRAFRLRLSQPLSKGGEVFLESFLPPLELRLLLDLPFESNDVGKVLLLLTPK
ncbi:hypothetical protein CBM2615_A10055 [Cupriavidus taiwanensis]|nr:hypothetical protein CBM2615_A10055 [Cupriavidus taiwanensis]